MPKKKRSKKKSKLCRFGRKKNGKCKKAPNGYKARKRKGLRGFGGGEPICLKRSGKSCTKWKMPSGSVVELR